MNLDLKKVIYSIVGANGSNQEITLKTLVYLLFKNCEEFRQRLPEDFNGQLEFAPVIAMADKVSAKYPDIISVLFTDWRESLREIFQILEKHTYTPHIPPYTSALATEMLNVKEDSRVFMPYYLDSNIIAKLPSSVEITTIVLSDNEYLWTCVKASLFDQKIQVRITRPNMWHDRLESIKKSKFDVAYIATLAFNILMGHRDAITSCKDITAALPPDCKIIAVVPGGFAFNQVFGEFRKYLIENRYLRRAIYTGKMTIFNSAAIDAYILDIDKSGTVDNHFLLIEPSAQQIRKEQSIEEIIKDPKTCTTIDCNSLDSELRISSSSIISTSLVAPKGFKLVELGEVAEVLPQRRRKVETNELEFHISGKTLSSLKKNETIEISDIAMTTLNGFYCKLEQSALLFHSMTMQARVLDWKTIEDPVYYTPNIYAILSKDKNISLEYLQYALRQPIVKAQFDAYSQGHIMARINSRDLLQLKILIPDTKNKSLFLQQIMRLLDEDRSIEIKEEKARSASELQGIEDVIADRIHLAAPKGLTVQQSLYRLSTLLKSGKVIDKDFNVFNGVTALELVNTALLASQDQGYVMSTMAGEFFAPPRPFDIKKFMDKYLENVKGDIAYQDIVIGDDVQENLPLINIDERSLRYIFSTLLNNACSHGFTGCTNKIVYFDVYAPKNGKYIVIEVANSGNRVPEGFSERLYRQKGGMAGPHASSGRGGYFVANAMDYYKGRMEIVTDDLKWSFIVKLFIPVVYE